MAYQDDVLFHAVVVPHRSLSQRGLRRLIFALCGSSFVVTTVFFLLGAWPVAGFSGVEITLAVLLLRLNARAVRRSEVIVVTPGTVQITRTDENGRKAGLSLDAAWLNVVLQERQARVPGLYLCSRTEQEEVARDIGEAEKRSLAEALSTALYQWRNPIFDNPQLRG